MERSYAEEVNEPLSPATVAALKVALAGPNPARYRRQAERDMPPDPPQAKWRIWSNVKNKWYLPQARGFTSRIEESGRFTPMEALQIYERAANGWDPLQPFAISITLVPVPATTRTNPR
jgi:hypothetical protein